MRKTWPVFEGTRFETGLHSECGTLEDQAKGMYRGPTGNMSRHYKVHSPLCTLQRSSHTSTKATASILLKKSEGLRSAMFKATSHTECLCGSLRHWVKKQVNLTGNICRLAVDQLLKRWIGLKTDYKNSRRPSPGTSCDHTQAFGKPIHKKKSMQVYSCT